jgi:NADH:ubiquinone oxidoreductase subunit 5 (subunit L)/multisubunit Na+/H+ antiporter MnhA subunit
MVFTAHHDGAPGWLRALSLGLAAAGFGLAWAGYQRRALDPERLAATFPLNVLDFAARRRYGLDALYGGLYRLALLGLARVVGLVDRYLVDGLVNLASAWALRAGDRLRQIQSGHAQDYVYGVAFGVLLLIVWAQWGR